MTVFEVTRAVYEGLVSGSQEYSEAQIKDMLQTLYQTKDINPPYFFSFSFSVGVYLPLLSPLAFPPLITLFQYLKLRFLKKKHLKTD